MSNSGPASPNSPTTPLRDVQMMTLPQIDWELRQYRPTNQNEVRTDPEWIARRAELWYRADLMRMFQAMYNESRRRRR